MKNVLKKILLTIMILIALYRVTSSQPSEVIKEIDYSGDSMEKANKTFELYQSNPLQFKEVTSIKFDIFTEGRVNLKVYDSKDILIQTLADGNMEAGKYNVYFKADDNLAPGVYKCILEVDGASQRSEMTLVR